MKKCKLCEEYYKKYSLQARDGELKHVIEEHDSGLAVLAGVKTSVASLWTVNDAGTAALMTKFYENLKTAPIKAEALRLAQVAMAKGQIYVKNGQIEGLGAVGNLPLPINNLDEGDTSLSHPYYWAAFTMVGNPW